jgi:hypothetical protein
MRIQMLIVRALGAIALSAATAASASAQSPTVDSRFQPWMGCWRTVNVPSAPGRADVSPTSACVLPSLAGSGGVEIALYTGDSLLSMASVVPAGTATPRTLDDCTGMESSEWSANEARLIMRAALTCARGVKRVETGLMTMAPNGEWVQLQYLEVGKNAATTVARFRFAADLTAQQPRLRGVSVSNDALRLAMGGSLTPDHVLDVAASVPVGLAQTWVAEMGQPYELNGKALVRLADRGMPAPVLDVMVALSNPKAFVVGAGRPDQVVGVEPLSVAVRTGTPPLAGDRTLGSRCSIFDDFCYGPGGMGAWGLGWQYGYALDPWGYPASRFGSRFGFSPYGYGFPYGRGFGNGIYYGQQPIIVVTRPSGSDQNGAGSGSERPLVRGRAVSGGGYTRASDGGGGAAPRTTSQSTGSSSAGGSAGGEGGSTGGAASGGGEARTAKPRPPGGP